MHRSEKPPFSCTKMIRCRSKLHSSLGICSAEKVLFLPFSILREDILCPLIEIAFFVISITSVDNPMTLPTRISADATPKRIAT